MKKALHFGGGVIGIGLVVDLLRDSDFEVTIVDVNDYLVNQINEDEFFELNVIEDEFSKKTLTNLSAVSSLKNPEDVIEEIVQADIITTAVWAENLSKIAPILHEGLKRRQEIGKAPVEILACENAVFNTDILKKELEKISSDSTSWLHDIARFPNTAVDRMVFDKERNGKKTIDIGKDFELVVESNKLIDSESMPIKGATYTDNLIKYIERKLYIINLGHAWAGYVGYLQGYKIIQDVFNDNSLFKLTKSAMEESSTLLQEKYGFTKSEMDNYINFSLNRFKTPGITDSITRVCRSPIRKLGANERLVGPAVQCEEKGLSNELLITGIAAAFHFDNPEDSQSVELLAYVNQYGINQAITHFTQIKEESSLHSRIKEKYEEILYNRKVNH